MGGGPTGSSGSSKILSVDGNPLQEENKYESTFLLLPGDHQISITFSSFGLGKKSSVSSNKTGDTWTTGGIEKWVNISMKMNKPVILNAALKEGITYNIETTAKFDNCKFRIVANGKLIAENETSDLLVKCW